MARTGKHSRGYSKALDLLLLTRLYIPRHRA